MIGIEEIECPICECGDYVKISQRGRDLIRVKTVLCKDCGFLYQNPRRTKARMIEYYTKHYSKHYRASNSIWNMTPAQYETYKYGFAPLYHRISNYFKNSSDLAILDIGSGKGTNLKFLGTKFNTTRLYAIEPSIREIENLKEKGIKHIASDVASHWEKDYLQAFDLITLRHVFEHLHDPNGFLHKAKNCLKEDGLLYMAVPNVFKLGTEKLESSFFRVVHNYSFSKKTLANILTKNGFEIVNIEEGDERHDTELYVVAKVSKSSKEQNSFNSEFQDALEYLAPKLQQERTLMNRLLVLKEFLSRRYYILKTSFRSR